MRLIPSFGAPERKHQGTREDGDRRDEQRAADRPPQDPGRITAREQQRSPNVLLQYDAERTSHVQEEAVPAEDFRRDPQDPEDENRDDVAVAVRELVGVVAREGNGERCSDAHGKRGGYPDPGNAPAREQSRISTQEQRR